MCVCERAHMLSGLLSKTRIKNKRVGVKLICISDLVSFFVALIFYAIRGKTFYSAAN